MELNATAQQVQATLKSILEQCLMGLDEPRPEAEIAALCEQLGLYPLPIEHKGRVLALQIFAARVLPLFTAEVAGEQGDTQEEKLKAKNFRHWCRHLEAGETNALRTTALFMRLWSRGDALRFGAKN